MFENNELPPRGDRLAGKAAIVTGAGSRERAAPGIGYAMAVLFARQGARVVVADMDEARAESTLKVISEGGRRGFFHWRGYHTGRGLQEVGGRVRGTVRQSGCSGQQCGYSGDG